MIISHDHLTFARTSRLSALLCILFLYTSCSSEVGKDIPEPNADAGKIVPDTRNTERDASQRVGGVVLSPNPVEAIVTETIQMRYQVYNIQGSPMEDAYVTWQVEDTDIATIDAAGRLTAHEVGQTTLNASVDGVTESVAVHVLPLSAIDSIAIVPGGGEVGVGEELSLGVKAYRDDGSEIEALNLSSLVDWYSETPQTATIDADGRLQGISRGTVEVLAHLGELEARTDFRVELKFSAIDCDGTSCFAITTDGMLYTMLFENGLPPRGEPDGPKNDAGVWMPIFEKVELNTPVVFKSASARRRSMGNSPCAIAIDNRVYCWGQNILGTIGVDFQTSSVEYPTALDTELRFKIVGGGMYSTCGLSLEGSLYCWGNIMLAYNWIDEGIDIYEAHSYQPVLIGEGPFEDMVMPGYSVCVQAVKTQKWSCMGTGHYGELGNGSWDNQAELVGVAHPTSFSSVASTASFGSGSALCGSDLSHQIWCWGHTGISSSRGQFGHPIEIGYGFSSGVPLRTDWDLRLTALTALQSGFCGVTDDREIRCWGDNSGCNLGQQAPGRGIPDYRYMPQAPIAEIPANWEHLSGQCVLTEDGDIWCWGLRAASEDPEWPIQCEPTAQRMLTF